MGETRGAVVVGKLKTVVWDAPDIKGLADFYVGVAGLTQQYADDEWITLTSADGWRFGVQHAPDHVPPRWPDPEYPQQLHVDFRVADIDAAAAQAERLGARRLGGGETWHVLADPAGHQVGVPVKDLPSVRFRPKDVVTRSETSAGAAASPTRAAQFLFSTVYARSAVA